MAAPSKSMAKSKKLSEMEVDDFMKYGFDSSDESSSEESLEKVQVKPDTKKKEKNVKKKVKLEPKATEKNLKPKQKTLDRLKEQDPEFFKFLQSEDKELLDDFESGDDESDDDEDQVNDDDDDKENDDDEDQVNDDDDDKENDDDEDQENDDDDDLKKFEEDILAQSDDDDERDSDEEKFHKPPSKLEVASDESDDDSGDEKKGGQIRRGEKQVSLTMIKQWNESIQKQPTIGVFREMVQAFKAAVRSTSKSDEVTLYHVEGGVVFNGIVKMCLMEIVPALQQLLHQPNLQSLTEVPSLSKGKNWSKIKASVKSYLVDLLKLISSISEPAMINVLLKHLHKMVPLCSVFVRIAKKLVKKCIEIWSTGEETSRVLAFLCINKMIGLLSDHLLEPSLKQMYLAFVKNCKFTSPTTLPLINFMQLSLVEIFLIDSVLAYQYAFIYIRQLAIHLRNAITVKKKETVQAVYNWQFIHCIGLWVKLLGNSSSSDVLQPLIYPLTQTIIGTAKLQPTSKFYPLRFHCVRALTLLSDTTNTYIPVLPFLLEIFEQVDFNKKHKTQSFKPLNFSCVLKFSKAQTEEKAFKDGLIDQLYELLMDHLKVHSHSIGFPELVLPAVLQLKAFLKKCKIANYCKQIKQIVDKIDENSKFITQKRKYVNFTLENDSAVDAWERKIKDEGTPISKFYKAWRVLRDKELQHEISGKDRLTDVTELPTIKRPKGPIKPTDEEKKEFSALFDSDSEDSQDDEARFKADKVKNKKKKLDEDDGDDDSVEEFSGDNLSEYDSDELEQLAKSASEDDDDEEDEEEDDDENDNDDEDDEDDEDPESNDGNDKPQKDETKFKTKPKPSINRMERKRKLLQEGQGISDVVKEFKLDDF